MKRETMSAARQKSSGRMGRLTFTLLLLERSINSSLGCQPAGPRCVSSFL